MVPVQELSTEWIFVQEMNPDSPGHVVLGNHNITECLHACYEGVALAGCLSIGHNYISSECELHTHTRYSGKLTLVTAADWNYYESFKPCKLFS